MLLIINLLAQKRLYHSIFGNCQLIINLLVKFFNKIHFSYIKNVILGLNEELTFIAIKNILLNNLL